VTNPIRLVKRQSRLELQPRTSWTSRDYGDVAEVPLVRTDSARWEGASHGFQIHEVQEESRVFEELIGLPIGPTTTSPRASWSLLRICATFGAVKVTVKSAQTVRWPPAHESDGMPEECRPRGQTPATG